MGVRVRRVAAAVGIDSADLIHLLGEHPRLIQRDDLFPEEWLCQPARKARGTASAQVVIVDEALGVPFCALLQFGQRHRPKLRAYAAWLWTTGTLPSP